jgi:CPA1 family monovalent cation:H+ antiporter
MLGLISVLFAVAALFGWFSARVLRLPNTIGTMLLSAISSIALVLLAKVWPAPHDWALGLLHRVDFERLILHGMLSLLLFAGAFLLDLEALRKERLAVGLLAVCGTFLSILGVGGATYFVAHLFGYHSRPLECFLFGALIAPTDPVAVIEMLRRVAAPKHLEAQLAGESLFNDGVGAVIFIVLLGATHGTEVITPASIVLRVLISSGGGILLGIALAIPAAWLMRSVRNAPIDLLLSLSLAIGGYALGDALGVSAPLEAVSAALVLRVLIGRAPRELIAHQDLNHFWTNLDRIQNAILFVLLGCGFLVVAFHPSSVLMGLAEIGIVNVVRVLCVAAVLFLLRAIQSGRSNSVTVLTWGGLRGGLCIALALAIPANYGEGWIVTATYIVVVFSILVQGATIHYFLGRMARMRREDRVRASA